MTSVATPPRRPSARVDAVADPAVDRILALAAAEDVLSFAGGVPDAGLFDAAGIRTAFDEVLAADPRRALQYSTTAGDPALRDFLARRLTDRALPTDADQLLITNGAQQALQVVATTLLEPGDVVLVEEPCYLAALQCFRLAGARIVPVPCDDSGPDLAALHDLAAQEQPKLCYVVPDFQNPTGRSLTREQRGALAAAAARWGFWIVEDNPYGDLRYRGEPEPPVAAFPGAEDRTLSVGSLSKVLAPGMRLGWLRTPPGEKAFATVKQIADLHTSTLVQAAAARYLADHPLEAHLSRVRAAYGARRDAMLRALPGALPEGSAWTDPDGGMFVWVRLPDGHDTTALLPHAVSSGVAYVPGAPFFAGKPDPTTLRLSFVTHEPRAIAEGVHRLGSAVHAFGRDL
ncbi:PLP-dependent aminotransferase family protein [Streptomyces capoamus]|uniref:aminotransferase-like domain-containing protein n=1 Tax=Streptomyces capoamus TaxID=68183 RepID=UPI003394BC2E